jgi:hypothetical protein
VRSAALAAVSSGRELLTPWSLECLQLRHDLRRQRHGPCRAARTSASGVGADEAPERMVDSPRPSQVAKGLRAFITDCASHSLAKRSFWKRRPRQNRALPAAVKGVRRAIRDGPYRPFEPCPSLVHSKSKSGRRRLRNGGPVRADSVAKVESCISLNFW